MCSATKTAVATCRWGSGRARIIRAWTHSVVAGMQTSVRRLAAQGRGREAWPDARLRVVKLRRGDDYADLAESARSFRLRGPGDLCPAKLQPRYSVFWARSWLSMVGDLLGQVVADAGSYARAAVVLAVREERLLWWIKWLVARGAEEAARADWPLASIDEIDATHPYTDLAAAWLRGNLVGDDKIDVEPPPELRDFYRVPLGNWDDMLGDLLEQISIDAGSIRKASKAINMPRSTLSARLKRYRGQ